MNDTTNTTASADALLPADELMRRAHDVYNAAFDAQRKLSGMRIGAHHAGLLAVVGACLKVARTAANASEESSPVRMRDEDDDFCLARVLWERLPQVPGEHCRIDDVLYAIRACGIAVPHAVVPAEAVTEAMVEAGLRTSVPYLEGDGCGVNEVYRRHHVAAVIAAALAERARQRPKDDVSAPRDTDCEAIRDERIGVLARAADGSAAMTMLSRHGARRRHCIAEGIPFDTVSPPPPRDFDPETDCEALDVEEMLKTCVPGGDFCDPQSVCDSIREWFSERRVRNATTRDADPPRDFDPGTVIATLILDDGRTASDRVTGSWAAQVLRELGGPRS